MKRTLTFCSFILIVVMLVTFGGVAVLIMAYSQLDKEAPEEVPVEIAVVEDSESSIETALEVFQDEVDGFTALESLGNEESEQYVYKITTESGDDRYIAWGLGAIIVPEGITEISSGPVAVGMERAWAFVEGEENLLLSKEAIILR